MCDLNINSGSFRWAKGEKENSLPLFTVNTVNFFQPIRVKTSLYIFALVIWIPYQYEQPLTYFETCLRFQQRDSFYSHSRTHWLNISKWNTPTMSNSQPRYWLSSLWEQQRFNPKTSPRWNPLNGLTPSSDRVCITRRQDSQQATSRKEQWMDGTQRFEEPVSNSTVNSCGGVPMLIDP